MNVGPGWLPYREGLSVFEVQSEDFIVQIKKDKLDQEGNKRFSSYRSTGLVKSSRVPVQYAMVNALDSEHASVVSHKILRQLADGDIDEKTFSSTGKTCSLTKYSRGLQRLEKLSKSFS